MFNEATFREILFPSLEKYLSKRSLIKHSCSWLVKLLYYEDWTDKQKKFYILIRFVYNIRPSPIWLWNEHKGYKERNVRNETKIHMRNTPNIMKKDRALKFFYLHQNLMDPRYPRWNFYQSAQLIPNFYPRHLHYPCHPRYLADPKHTNLTKTFSKIHQNVFKVFIS